jgi:hypothetical protein
MPARPKKPGKQTQRRLRPHKMLECLEAHDRVGDAVCESGTALACLEIGPHQPDSRTRRRQPRLRKRHPVHIDPDDNLGNGGQLRRPVTDPACSIDDRPRADSAQKVSREQIAAEVLSLDPEMRVARVERVDGA